MLVALAALPQVADVGLDGPRRRTRDRDFECGSAVAEVVAVRGEGRSASGREGPRPWFPSRQKAGRHSIPLVLP